jgi:CHASE3 domain sensor protein
MNEHLAGARRLSAGNGDQLKRLDRIEVLIRTRVAHFEETRKAHETKPDDKAGETRRMRAGAELTQQLVALFDDFVSRENHLVNARVDERESHARLVMQ